MKISRCKSYTTGTYQGNCKHVGDFLYLPFVENQVDVCCIPYTSTQSQALVGGSTVNLDGLPFIHGHVVLGYDSNQVQLEHYADYAKEHGYLVILHTTNDYGTINAGSPAVGTRYVSLGRLDGDELVPCLDMPTMSVIGHAIESFEFHCDHNTLRSIEGIYVGSCPGGYNGDQGPCGPHFRMAVTVASCAVRDRGRPVQRMFNDFADKDVPGYPGQFVVFIKDGRTVTKTVADYLCDSGDCVGSDTYDFFWNML